MLDRERKRVVGGRAVNDSPTRKEAGCRGEALLVVAAVFFNIELSISTATARDRDREGIRLSFSFCRVVKRELVLGLLNLRPQQGEESEAPGTMHSLYISYCCCDWVVFRLVLS